MMNRRDAIKVSLASLAAGLLGVKIQPVADVGEIMVRWSTQHKEVEYGPFPITYSDGSVSDCPVYITQSWIRCELIGPQCPNGVREEDWKRRILAKAAEVWPEINTLTHGTINGRKNELIVMCA
jgi:hypothetical protein